ncbi:FecCD family ABC transporter permease [Vibrio hangzhouensis]|uniref:FecCD family ABC transporter permease n=1 Tax=Vibrio hangzhouensis TaxID=462991 RepID=UPI001C961458|nr:iron ABC transporter permease [Vibrio hangzhouensis]MBY6197744.1 iron ABC transporter permease [Vibrio hangzhouensis]
MTHFIKKSGLVVLLLVSVAMIITPPDLYWQAGHEFWQHGTYHPFWSITVPRVLLALMAGLMLALSGYLLQTTLKNPLADSGILGVNAGASLGAVCALLLPSWFDWGIDTETALIAFAMFGGLVATLPILLVSQMAGTSLTLLTGVAITAIIGAISSALIFTIGQGKTDLALQWMAGGLYGRGWEQIRYLLPWFITTLVFVAVIFVPLKWVRYDDSVLRGIGIKGPLLRMLILIGTALITAPAVSAVGPVGFVGLVIPHMARMLCGHAPLSTLLTTMFLGSVFLAGSDWLARTLLYPTEIPAGVITALCGVPFFLFLLRRNS